MALVSASPAVHRDPSAATASYRGPFAIMTLLFFLWGFMTVWNDLLIPQFKHAFQLTYFQAMLVQFAFFGAYAVGAAAYTIVSMLWGDPIARMGYRMGVILGLTVAGVGSLLFVPAAMAVSYPLFLGALFIVGLGFALLQIAANPYITILGREEGASARLNLSQAFNSFGTTIGPVVGGWLLFHVFSSSQTHGADAVKVPYAILAGVFLLLAAVFLRIRLPEFRSAETPTAGIGALRHPHTVLGMVAIFMYVGGEVAVGSSIINALGSPALGGIPERTASDLLAFYWGGLMIGRFMGALALSGLRTAPRVSLMIVVPILALLLVAGVAQRVPDLRYGVLVGCLLASFLAIGRKPQRMLAVFALLIIGLLGTAIVAHGPLAMWALLGIGLFCSVMWSNIFSLAIEGLGDLKGQGSSLLVMAILGGALIPPIQGAVADRWGIQASFVVPMIAFAYIVFYGIWGWRAGRRIPA
jgi:FHS family L-fucose permease-like MFS transporter